MGIDYVKLGYNNAKEEAEMEAALLAIVKADMVKPHVYIPIEPAPYVPLIVDVIDVAKDIGKIVLSVTLVNTLGVGWFDGT